MEINPPKSALSLKGFAVLAVGVIIADQLAKWAIVSHVTPERPLVLIPRFLQFIRRTNTGAAFSIFTGHTIALALFSTVVATGLVVWSWRLHPEELILRWPLGLILGGAVGNLVDRYRLGRVVDFIDAHVDDRYHFATFNVADSAICVGMALLILISLIVPNRPNRK